MTMAIDGRLAQVSEILIALAGSPIPSQQFQVLVDYAGLAIPYDFLAFCLVDEFEDQYQLYALDGAAKEVMPLRPYQRTEGVVGRVLQNRQPEIIDDLQKEPDAHPDLEAILIQCKLQSALILPIRQERKVLGALYFAAEALAAYSAEDLQIGALLAAGMASSLETARYYQRLADERSTLAAVLSSTQDGVVVVNEVGVVLLANPAFEEMFALPLGTLASNRLVDKVDEPALIALFTQEAEVMEIALPDGRIVQAGIAEVVTDFGEFVGWTAVLRDISLFKTLEQMKNDFVNTVSHDLKNPIGTISLAAEFMGQAGALNETQSDMQARILRTTTYMNELVTDLLDLGKLQAGIDLQKRSFDLIPLLEDVLLAADTSITLKKQQITKQHPPQLHLVADKQRIQQLLLNLIGNASKYTPDNGEISINVTSDETQVRISVQDNGFGIAAPELPYLFDKFYRVQNEQTRNIKGTGLGLAITQTIVEAHNGRIWVDSIFGEGSTFTFTLPLI